MYIPLRYALLRKSLRMTLRLPLRVSEKWLKTCIRANGYFTRSQPLFDTHFVLLRMSDVTIKTLARTSNVKTLSSRMLVVVPGTGIEPARCFHHTLLKRARLPISPSWHVSFTKVPSYKKKARFRPLLNN